MRRQAKDFSGIVKPLFETMLIQHPAEVGEDSGQPTEPQHIPATASPSHIESIPTVASSQPKKTQKHRKTKRKATEISQFSRPTTLVADETVHEERGDRVVFDLENIKDAQALEIQKLKKRVRRLEKKEKVKNSITQEEGRNDQDEEISFVQEDAETQGRYGHDIKVNTSSTSITIASINLTAVEPVTTVSAQVTTADVSVSTAEPSAPPPTTTTLIEDKDEPEKPVKGKGKDQIALDEEVARRLEAQMQAEFEEEERVLEGSGKKAKSSEKEAVSKKRTKEEINQESSKRQKTSESSELAKEPRDKEADELSQEELQQMMIIVPVQGMNVVALQTKEENRHLHAGREGILIVKRNSYIDAGSKALGGSR
uniref:Uncharacterized protein n=1 Tax=Tanacetum cinerariifolium TaxID=118510 RepID=A0A699IFL1_TANCI|nr:hypothetical protein [Tanacetum cinerariifolium]